MFSNQDYNRLRLSIDRESAIANILEGAEGHMQNSLQTGCPSRKPNEDGSMAILEQALAELRRQNEEKSTLLAELRHRMKNNLQTVQSLLRIQKSRTQNAAVRCELAALETHVAALNGVDGELLALEGDRAIDLAIYFRRLMLKLKEAFHTDCSPLTFRLNLESVIVPCRTAADLGLLINEAVTNSFKHAVPKGASEICLTPARNAWTRNSGNTVLRNSNSSSVSSRA